MSQQESQVAAAGWKLQQEWPAQSLAGLTAITALTGYDGMCRPLAFNVFVFSGTIFAGTLSPAPMNSREDGVLQLVEDRPALPGAVGGLTAAFTRYAPSDPLCCPSKGTTRVAYEVDRLGGGPVLRAMQIGDAAAPALPKTGGGGAHRWPWPAAAIVAAALVGLWVGRRRIAF